MKEALRLHEEACRSDDPRACRRLFEILASGDGVARDLARAMSFATRACVIGGGAACLSAGLWHLNGEGAKHDLQRATELLEPACRDGRSGLACCALATAYASSNGGAAMQTRVHAVFDDACSLGEGHACVASYALNEEISPGVSDAVTNLSEACADPYPGLGCPRGCELNDASSRRRRKKALRTLNEACDQREAKACFLLGLIYKQSLGVSADSSKAAALLERACVGGVPSACYRLAHLYSLGSGDVKQDFERARGLARKACEAGLRDACGFGG